MGRDEERGFTLVEVLVALVVTSLLLSIVMNGALSAKMRLMSASDRSDAVLLAETLIAERSSAQLDITLQSGESGGLSWRSSETVVAADPRGLFALAEVTVEVRRGDATLAALMTRRLKPVPLT